MEVVLGYLLVIIIGLLYGNLWEWILHKYVLHSKSAKTNKSIVSFHWTSHHRTCRKNGFVDTDRYPREIAALVGILVLQLPWLYISKVFYCTLVYCALNYYFMHRKAHRDPEWCKRHMPWHFDHHMGRNQDMNWCVTRPWFDHIFGTRKVMKHSKAPAVKDNVAPKDK
jgi:sterol desaturase/sphingolipid hydroxylase (fatty acid hydroxylase superfamily)